MENTAPRVLATDEIRAARAEFVGDELREERWSIRKAAMALGMSHSALGSRLKAETAFLAEEIEGIAHLLKEEPSQFFARYLRAHHAPEPTNNPSGDYVAADSDNVIPLFGRQSA